jgi:hypothetical protein
MPSNKRSYKVNLTDREIKLEKDHSLPEPDLYPIVKNRNTGKFDTNATARLGHNNAMSRVIEGAGTSSRPSHLDDETEARVRRHTAKAAEIKKNRKK